MTPSELKSKVNATGSKYFDYAAMRMFGDTMANYGVRKTKVDTPRRKGVPCYELYRKRPVKEGLRCSAFFDATTFNQIYD